MIRPTNPLVNRPGLSLSGTATTMAGTRILIAIFTLMMVAREASAGILDRLREDVRRKETGQADNLDNHATGAEAHPHSNQPNPWGSVLGPPVMAIITSPVWVPRQILQDQGNLPGCFLDYPYQQGKPGWMVLDPVDPIGQRQHARTVRFQYGEDFGDLMTLSSHFLIQGTHRWGLDAGFDYRREKLTPTSHDQLWTGTINIVNRFAQSENVQMYLGVGANFLDDSDDTNWGVNVTYGGDWMVDGPWIMSLDLDVGRVGHASLSHLRWTIGVAVRRYELYIGFDHYQAGGTELDQMVTGIRLWF